MLRYLTLAGMALALLCGGCNSHPQVCSVGTAQACTCGTEIGYQVCQDGRSFEPCQCETPTPNGGEAVQVFAVQQAAPDTCRLGPPAGTVPIRLAGPAVLTLDTGTAIYRLALSAVGDNSLVSVRLWSAEEGPQLGDPTSRFVVDSEVWFRDGADVKALDGDGNIAVVATCPEGTTGAGLAYDARDEVAWYDCGTVLHGVVVYLADGTVGELAVELAEGVEPGSLRYSAGLAWQQVATDVEPRRFCLLGSGRSVECNPVFTVADGGQCAPGQDAWDFHDSWFACVSSTGDAAHLFTRTPALGSAIATVEPGPLGPWAGTDGRDLFYADGGLHRKPLNSAALPVESPGVGAIWDLYRRSDVYLCGRNSASDAVVVWRYTP